MGESAGSPGLSRMAFNPENDGFRLRLNPSYDLGPAMEPVERR